MEKEYYKAYENRYKACHKKNMLWENTKPSLIVEKIIKKYNITNKSKILDLGCGEGRDAIYLLNNCYNVTVLDYSKSAIEMCKKITNHKYDDKFKTFDILEDKLEEKYDFIYSVCVLHMFVKENHRKQFLDFVKNHLTVKGKALIIVMGDGILEKETDITKAFDIVKRININTNSEIKVTNTSCKIVNWETLFNEIKNSNLKILENFISDDVPGFNITMCVILEKS